MSPAAAWPALRDLWRGWRDRLVSDAGFRERAARFPPTRLLARRRAAALFDLCAGFAHAQVLLALTRLRVLEALRPGPLGVAEVAALAGLPEASATRLLEAGAALGLLDRRSGGRYGLGPLGAAAAGNPGLAAMIEHHDALYADLADPVALLRRGGGGGAVARDWPYARADMPAELGAESVAPYSALMSASQPMIAAEVLDAYPEVARHRRLLDLGGGEAAFLIAAAARAPGLELRLLDLPAVAGLARAALARAGLSGRAEALGGDFLRDPLPEGADLISLVRVLHDHEDGPALALLRRARAALAPGGRLLVAEPMTAEAGAEARAAAYLALYLLAMGSGRPRREAELRDLLARAGFARVEARRTRLPLLARVLVAAA